MKKISFGKLSLILFIFSVLTAALFSFACNIGLSVSCGGDTPAFFAVIPFFVISFVPFALIYLVVRDILRSDYLFFLMPILAGFTGSWFNTKGILDYIFPAIPGLMIALFIIYIDKYKN